MESGGKMKQNMNVFFYLAAAVALISSVLTITRHNAIHALLYLILSLLSISVIFYLLGAPFIAALEVIIYAGAIMVLFIFVVMMLNIGMEAKVEKAWMKPRMWILPSILSLVILFDLVFMLYQREKVQIVGHIINPKQIGLSLFTTYLLIVEITAILLLAGIIGAYHLGKQKKKVIHRYLK
jgi:NADH-quinone oxidoreductase subunit J